MWYNDKDQTIAYATDCVNCTKVTTLFMFALFIFLIITLTQMFWHVKHRKDNDELAHSEDQKVTTYFEELSITA